MPRANHQVERPEGEGNLDVLRLRFDDAYDHFPVAELPRLCRLAILFGRYRVVTRLAHLLSEPEYLQFLRERALPQVPIGGDVTRGFGVDEQLLAEIAGRLQEPLDALLASTVRLMLAGGSRHIAKLYVLARLSGDLSLVERLQPAFDARAAWPRARLAADVTRRFSAERLQAGDDDDYNPKSAWLFAGKEVVIKEHLRLHVDPSRLDGYSEERELLESLDHPRIVRLVDIAAVQHHELLLLRRVDAPALDGSQLPRTQALLVAAQLADTLAWLHARDIIYMDVKAKNVLFDGREVTLCDFGMARRGRRVTSMLSTLEYVPPEMAREFSATPASDVFQLGILTHQLLTGRHPFTDGEGFHVALANSSGEPDLRAAELGSAFAVVRQMLSHRADDRPTAAQVCAEL